MMKIPIISPSRYELQAFLDHNPWINRDAVVPVTDAKDLRGRAGLVLALPGWQYSPSIRSPRELLEVITARGMQLVVLEQAAYQLKAMSDVVTKTPSAYQHTVRRFEGELP